MNQKWLNYHLFLLTTLSISHCNGTLLDTVKPFFAADRDEREEQLTHLKEEYEKFKSSTSEFLKKTAQKLETTNRRTTDLKEKIKKAPADLDFLNKELSLENESYQSLFNIQFTVKEIGTTDEQHIKTLEDYKKDPTFKELMLEDRSFYPFEAVQNANKKVLLQEDVIAQITAQKNDAVAELENRKKKLSAATKELQDRKRAQEEFGKTSAQEDPEGKLTFNQQGQLLDLEQKLANYDKQLAELKVQEINRKIGLINTKIFIENEKLKIFKANLEKAKTHLRINQADVITAQEVLEKSKQETLATKEKLYDEIKKLSFTRDKLKKDLENLSKKNQISISPHLTTWSVETPSLETFTAITQMANKNAQIGLLDRKIEYLRAQIDLAQATFIKNEINFKVIQVWFKITQRQYKKKEEIQQEIQYFKDLENELNREITLLQDKRTLATNMLGMLNKELGEIKRFTQTLQQEKDLIFKKFPSRYSQLLTEISEAEKAIAEHIDFTTKLVEIYTNNLSLLGTSLKELSFNLQELASKSIWQRSEHAITWDGIKNIGSDLSLFMTDVRNLASNFWHYWRWQNLLYPFMKLWKHPILLSLLIILALLAIVGFIYFYKRVLPLCSTYIESFIARQTTYKRPLEIVYYFATATANFIKKYVIIIGIWFLLFLAFYFDLISDFFLNVLFYIVSIPFLLYLATKFIRYIIKFNRDNNYILFASTFEKRFIIVTSLFSYVSIIFLYLREAFIIATLHKSELPTILLASYSIFLRTLIIFSIGKEEIIALLKNKGPFWSWLAIQIDKYYYLLLTSIVIIMIVSDPFVGGYGNLVSYLLWGLIGSIILVKLLLIGHQYIKKWSLYLFFATDEESMRERFRYGKTLYGLFVIAAFLLLLFGVIFLASKLWHIPFTFKDVMQMLNFQIFETGIDKLTGQPIWFTPLKLLVIILFILSGFLVALLFDRFALGLVFEVLPVDPGVQNTVSSITRYLILIIAIYMGFQWGGLGTLLIAIGVVLGSISWIVKEPVADFISYFIILVQRPIQIGDYILIDEENQGVVRKITARSTILRRKDSYTIILPNSVILSKPISNWNYARNFVAFDDIEFAVPFTVDPALVKKLATQVIDENPDVLKSPKPIIRLHEFGENGYIFKLRGFLSDVNIIRKWDIASDVRLALVQKLKEHDIKIAVPTRVIISMD